MQFRPGIPLFEEYRALLADPVLAAMQAFSGRFIATHKTVLEPYARKWVPDSLNQWSRPWEYGYCFDAIQAFMRERTTPARILDAGSGVTFMPYYVAAQWPLVTLDCCDADPDMASMFAAINAAQQPGVTFRVEDLRQLTYADATFDLVYCISVLEHTDDFQAVIRHFRRLLKPGGRLVLTFDISVDGARDIPPDRAQQLLDALAAVFRPLQTHPDLAYVRQAVKQPHLLTSTLIYGIMRQHIPNLAYDPHPLTICCATYV